MYPQIGRKQKIIISVHKREALLNISMHFTLTLLIYSWDLLFALSLEYNMFVYLFQRNIMLEKDNSIT